MINVEVCYGTAEKQILKSVKVPEESTAFDAVKASGIQTDFPEINLADLVIGIFSRKITVDHIVKEGDRVEIYRPLVIDPMTKRRLKARS